MFIQTACWKLNCSEGGQFILRKSCRIFWRSQWQKSEKHINFAECFLQTHIEHCKILRIVGRILFEDVCPRAWVVYLACHASLCSIQLETAFGKMVQRQDLTSSWHHLLHVRHTREWDAGRRLVSKHLPFEKDKYVCYLKKHMKVSWKHMFADLWL